jgi:hypothetical protein
MNAAMNPFFAMQVCLTINCFRQLAFDPVRHSMTHKRKAGKTEKITAAQPWLCCMHAKCCRGEVDAGKTPFLNVESTAGVLSSPH